MKKSIKKSFITSGLLTLLLISSNMPGYCKNNATLSAINIEGNKQSFNITLKTSADVEIESKVLSNDRLVLELEDTKAAVLLQTKFNKASNIEDVIVQPISNNRTRLFISGKNVSKSKIIIDSTKTPIIADQFAQDESYSIIKRNKRTQRAPEAQVTQEVQEAPAALEEQIANEETVSAEDFIANNQAETTGVISAPPETVEPVEEVEAILEDTTETAEVAETAPVVLSSDLFKPEADLSYESTNTNTQARIKAPVESAAATTVKSIQTKNNSLPFSNSGLMRFAIAFILLGVLIGYLKKENLISFNGKKSHKPALRKEPLDISRSLNRPSRVTTTKRSASSLDRVTPARTRSRITASPNTTTIKKHSALSGYTKQQQQKPQNLVNRQKQSQTLSKNPLLNKQGFNKQLGLNNKTTQGVTSRATQGVVNRATQATQRQTTQKKMYNQDFLKSMADHYEKTGRHDLAKNIQRSLNK